jgi:fucose permease
MASIFPIMISLAERRMTITGRITSWFFVGASTGSMSLPWLIGQLFESVGPRVMVFTVLVDLIVAVFIFAGVMLHSNRPVMDEE